MNKNRKRRSIIGVILSLSLIVILFVETGSSSIVMGDPDIHTEKTLQADGKTVQADTGTQGTAAAKAEETSPTLTALDANGNEISEAKAGDELTYRIHFKNEKDTTDTITVTQNLPQGMDFVSSTKVGTLAEDGRTVTWIRTNEPANTEDEVSVTVKVTDAAAGNSTAQASVTASDGTKTQTNQTKLSITVPETPAPTQAPAKATPAAPAQPEESKPDEKAGTEDTKTDAKSEDTKTGTEDAKADDTKTEDTTDKKDSQTTDTGKDTKTGTQADKAKTTEKSATEKNKKTVVYTTQPTTKAEVKKQIDDFMAKYEKAQKEGTDAVNKLQKPHWKTEVKAELMPDGYYCEKVTDDKTFGADYYTFYKTPEGRESPGGDKSKNNHTKETDVYYPEDNKPEVNLGIDIGHTFSFAGDTAFDRNNRNVAVIANDEPYNTGAMWAEQRLDLRQPFTTEMQLFMGHGTNWRDKNPNAEEIDPGDGMTFTLQNAPTLTEPPDETKADHYYVDSDKTVDTYPSGGSDALGSDGEGLGAYGSTGYLSSIIGKNGSPTPRRVISNALCVEFDLKENGRDADSIDHYVSDPATPKGYGHCAVVQPKTFSNMKKDDAISNSPFDYDPYLLRNPKGGENPYFITKSGYSAKGYNLGYSKIDVTDHMGGKNEAGGEEPPFNFEVSRNKNNSDGSISKYYWHDFSATWTPTDISTDNVKGTLTYTLDGNTRSISIDTDTYFEGNNVYWGFTGSTGDQSAILAAAITKWPDQEPIKMVVDDKKQDINEQQIPLKEVKSTGQNGQEVSNWESDQFDYTLQYINYQKTEATVTLEDTIPNQLEIIDIDGKSIDELKSTNDLTNNTNRADKVTLDVSEDKHKLKWTFTNLLPGVDGLGQVKITVKAILTGMVTNNCTMKVGDDDPKTSNNVINYALINPTKGIVDKETDSEKDSEGKLITTNIIDPTDTQREFTYRIKGRNYLDDSEQTMRIKDTLPLGLEYKSAEVTAYKWTNEDTNNAKTGPPDSQKGSSSATTTPNWDKKDVDFMEDTTPAGDDIEFYLTDEEKDKTGKTINIIVPNVPSRSKNEMEPDGKTVKKAYNEVTVDITVEVAKTAPSNMTNKAFFKVGTKNQAETNETITNPDGNVKEAEGYMDTIGPDGYPTTVIEPQTTSAADTNENEDKVLTTGVAAHMVTAPAGGYIKYTITYKNHGKTAQYATITDALQEKTSFYRMVKENTKDPNSDAKSYISQLKDSGQRDAGSVGLTYAVAVSDNKDTVTFTTDEPIPGGSSGTFSFWAKVAPDTFGSTFINSAIVDLTEDPVDPKKPGDSGIPDEDSPKTNDTVVRVIAAKTVDVFDSKSDYDLYKEEPVKYKDLIKGQDGDAVTNDSILVYNIYMQNPTTQNPDADIKGTAGTFNVVDPMDPQVSYLDDSLQIRSGSWEFNDSSVNPTEVLDTAGVVAKDVKPTIDATTSKLEIEDGVPVEAGTDKIATGAKVSFAVEVKPEHPYDAEYPYDAENLDNYNITNSEGYRFGANLCFNAIGQDNDCNAFTTNMTRNPMSDIKRVSEITRANASDDKSTLPGKEKTIYYPDTVGHMVTRGDTLTYTIYYKNTGNTGDLTITDTIPQHTTFVADSAKAYLGKEDAPSTAVPMDKSKFTIDKKQNSTDQEKTDSITWTLKDIPKGGEGTVTFRVQVDGTASEGELINNTAKINGVDTNITENPVNPVKDTDPPNGSKTEEGSEISYILSYMNTDQKPQTIAFTDKVPVGTKFIGTESVEVNKLPYTGAVQKPDEATAEANQALTDLTWSGIELEPEARAYVKFKVKVDEAAYDDLKAMQAADKMDRNGAPIELDENGNPIIPNDAQVSVNKGKDRNGNDIIVTAWTNRVTHIVTEGVQEVTFSFTKIDGTTIPKDKTDITNQALPGASFKLYKKADPAPSGVESDLLAPDPHLNDSEQSDTLWIEPTNEVTSGEDGKVTFEHVALGTYMLVETQAPDGYELPKGQWEVKLEAQSSGEGAVTYADPADTSHTVQLTITAKPYKDATQRDILAFANDYMYLTNRKPFALPLLGTMPYTALYIAGAILVLGAATMLLYRRKKRIINKKEHTTNNSKEE